MVLSEDYLKAEYTQPEWAAAFARDPRGQKRKLVPFRVKDCNPTGILSQIIYVDLVGLTSADARTAVLGAFAERAKPPLAPAFPGEGLQARQARVAPESVQYPGKGRNVSLSQSSFLAGRDDVLQEPEAARHQKVMVSSTARDLPDHRQGVLDACLRQGMFPLMME